MVLIIVAIVVALVSLAAMGFLDAMRTENRSAHLLADQIQAQQIAASGAEFLQALARLPREQRLAWGSLQNNPALFRDVRVDWDLAGQRHGRFCILAPLYADDSSQAEFFFGAEDCCAKLSLPTLLLWDQIEPGQGRQALMNLPGMNESLADAILDWIDPDDQPREFGAESEFYLGLDPPRAPPNQIPARIDDLLAVRGMSAWQLLGQREGLFPVRTTDDDNSAFAELTPARAMRQTAPQAGLAPAPPWIYFLTVRSAERNEGSAGGPRIDLNQDDLVALHSALSAQFDQQVADFVVALRQYGPAGSGAASALHEPIPSLSTSEQGRYRLDSPLDLVDAAVTIPSPTGDGQDKSPTYASPFSGRQPSSPSSLIEFCDATTTEPAAVLEGRINVQLAPRQVLLGIPFLSTEQVDQIVSARAASRDDNHPRQHAAWLLADGLVDLETMQKIWPFVTVSGDVFRAQIVAYYDATSPWCRYEIEIDATNDAISPVYCRDLGHLGVGFRWQELMSPASAEQNPSSDMMLSLPDGAQSRRFLPTLRPSRPYAP
jgi:hypothetical protein